VVAAFAGSTDYSATSASATFIIAQAVPTVTVTDAGGTFNGKTFPATATVTGVSGTPASSLEGVTPTLTYYSGSTASGTPLSGAPSAVGTYTVVANFAGSTDYTAAAASTTFVISSSGSTKTTPTIVVTDAGGTYNGKTFPATATIAGSNGTPGTKLEGVALKLAYYAGSTATGTALSGAPKAAGMYTVVASFAGSPDYNATSTSTTFVIAQATPALTVTDAGGTFDGKTFPATVTVAGVNGVAGSGLEKVSPTLSYYAQGSTTALSGAPKAAGSYEVVASFAGSTDYAAALVSTTFVIAQATPPVTVSDPGGTYTGKAFKATDTVTGVSGTAAGSLEGIRPTVTYYELGAGGPTALSSAPSAVGNYEAVASFAGSPDYTAAKALVTFAITPDAPTVAVDDCGGTFDGQSFAATATVAGVSGNAGASLEGVTPTLTYYAGTSTSGTALSGAPSAAGTYTVVAAFAGSADYSTSCASTTFVIARAAPALTVSACRGTYSGQQFVATATLAGVVSGVDSTPAAGLEGVTPTLTYYRLNADGSKTLLGGAPTAAGNYEVDAHFAGSADYAPTCESTTFTIRRAHPEFSLPTSVSVAQGTPTTTVSGTLGLGGLIPTGQVTITIDGVSTTATVQADGTFTAQIVTGSLAVGKHVITFHYSGDANFKSILGKEELDIV
jgi:hypothetical protein